MASCMTGVLLLTHAHWWVEIAGLPLVHRVLLSGRKAGIQHWIILCGMPTPETQERLARSTKLHQVTWQIYDLKSLDPRQLTALLPQEDVLLMTVPAAFDHRLLARFQEATAPTLGVHQGLALSQEQVDVKDSRVSLEPVMVPTGWQSAGLLRCSGALLGQAIARNGETLGQMPVPLAALFAGCLAQTTLHALDVSPQVWVPLAEPLEASVKEAEARLLRSLGRDGDSLFVRLVDRRISQAITKRLMHTSVRPNHITLCSALIGLSGAWLLAQPVYLWQVVGSLLFLLSTIIDGCDGELARLTFQESEFGAKLDVCMDNVVHVFLFPSIALGLYWRAYDKTYLLLGCLTLLGILLSMAVFLPYLWRRQTTRSTLARVHEHLASRDFAYALPLLALVDKLHWFLWATTIGTYVFAVAWIVIVAQVQRQQRLVDGQGASSL